MLYVTRIAQNKNDSIFDPVSQVVQMEGSYHLLSYKD